MTLEKRVFWGALALAGLAFLATLAPARAQDTGLNERYAALRADPELESGVLVVAIGDIMRDNCSQFELRRVRAATFFWGLVARARELGYSDDDIRAYVDNDADQARVEARARQWFVQEGADLNDPETICAVARDQIAAGSAIGRLLREG